MSAAGSPGNAHARVYSRRPFRAEHIGRQRSGSADRRSAEARGESRRAPSAAVTAEAAGCQRCSNNKTYSNSNHSNIDNSNINSIGNNDNDSNAIVVLAASPRPPRSDLHPTPHPPRPPSRRRLRRPSARRDGCPDLDSFEAVALKSLESDFLFRPSADRLKFTSVSRRSCRLRHPRTRIRKGGRSKGPRR